MTQEIGWDYDHANQSGKNLFVYLDTDHTNMEVQDRLTNELEDMIQRKFFDVVFMEGYSGIYMPPHNFPNEGSFRKAAIKRAGRVPAVDLLIYRNQEKLVKGELVIYGVEDESLFTEHRKSMKYMLEQFKKLEKDPDDLVAKEEFDKYRLKCDQLTHQRSVASSRKIQDQMVQRGLVNAGLIYGLGHFDAIKMLIKEEGLGYLSFFPGKPEVVDDKVFEHIEKL